MENFNPNQEHVIVNKEISIMALKKDKKYRQLMRQTILNRKDPQQIIAEMENIDLIEYHSIQSPQYITALKDKRRRLKETLDRILDMYAKNDQFKWAQLKGQMDEVEKKRKELDSYFEAVRLAQQAQVSEIPLTPPTTSNSVGIICGTSFTSEMPLSSLQYYEHRPSSKTRQPPGPPPGLPQNAMQRLKPTAQNPADANILTTMIEKKPEIKFVPMTLRMKRLNLKKNPLVVRPTTAKINRNVQQPQRSTDDSYRQFMQDIGPLLSS